MSWAAINPVVLNWNGNSAPRRVQILAEDSKTWKQGEIGYLTSGTLTPVSSATGGTTAPYYRFCETQSSSTSTSTVWAQEIRDGTEAMFWLTSNGTDTACDQANVGLSYGLYTASNITYIDENVTSGADWQVVNLLSLVMPIMHTLHAFNAAPGIVIARYEAA